MAKIKKGKKHLGKAWEGKHTGCREPGPEFLVAILSTGMGVASFLGWSSQQLMSNFGKALGLRAWGLDSVSGALNVMAIFISLFRGIWLGSSVNFDLGRASLHSQVFICLYFWHVSVFVKIDNLVAWSQLPLPFHVHHRNGIKTYYIHQDHYNINR